MQGYISGVGNLSSQQGGDIDTFINISVDYIDVPPTGTVNIKGKDYDKYILPVNNITVKRITSLSDDEIIQISDLLHYKLFPLSNNDDMGLYLSYDGTTLTAFVANNNTSVRGAEFYFTFIYNVVPATVIIIEDYIDIVGGNSGGGTNNLPIVDANVEYKSAVGLKKISIPSASATYTSYTTQGDNDSVIMSGRATSTSGDYFPRFLYDGGKLSTSSSNYSNFTIQFATLRYNYIKLEGVTPSSSNYMTVSGTYELYSGDTLVYTRSVDIGLAAGAYTTIINPKHIENVEFDKCVIKIKSTAATNIKLSLSVSLQYNCNAIDINTNCLQVLKIHGNYDILSINNKPGYMSYTDYIDKTFILLTQENQQTVHFQVIEYMQG